MVEPTVLIVEDSPPMTEILKKIFQDNVGCTILEATDGIEAVKKIQAIQARPCYNAHRYAKGKRYRGT